MLKPNQSVPVVVDEPDARGQIRKRRTRGRIIKLHHDAGRLAGVSIATGRRLVWRPVEHDKIVEDA